MKLKALTMKNPSFQQEDGLVAKRDIQKLKAE
jgi:hypothetical protein